MKHPKDVNYGEECECPICGAPCIKVETEDNNINCQGTENEYYCWYNTHTKNWECSECWLK